MTDDDNLYNFVYNKILNFLAFKSRSEAEVEKKTKEVFVNILSGKYSQITSQQILLASSKSEEIASQLKDNFKAEGYLDDEKYARTYIASIVNSSRPKSLFVIQNFLTKKGINKNIINTAISELDEDVEYKAALATAEKKVRVSKEFGKNTKKLVNYLLRKGFKYSLAVKIAFEVTKK